MGAICCESGRVEEGVGLLGGMYADLGLSRRVRLAGWSKVGGRVVVEALLVCPCLELEREVLEALEMESKRRWNLRLVVARATGMVVEHGRA